VQCSKAVMFEMCCTTMETAVKTQEKAAANSDTHEA